MPIKFYDSLTRQLKQFRPIKSNNAGMYACGPTVYNYAHIGNLRAYVFEDILKRVLVYNNYKVNHVMNITDVGHLTSDADDGEDKIEKGAKRENKTAWEIAEFYTEAFKKDLTELNIVNPKKYCKASNFIKEQIKLIKKLEKKGFTYKTTDGVYFDTSKLIDYGKLARLDRQQLKAGARVDIGEKRNKTDFALWKFSPSDHKRQMEWESPWGTGFPGWHIECSAMSTKFLGQPFDIHCGGIDHIPVHHTNEIAQSEAANNKPLANYWLHSEFLLLPEGKMAKSKNNFITLNSIKEKNNSPLAYRYFLLQTHYRKQLTFSWEALEAANNGLKHLYQSVALLNNDKKINDDKIISKFLNLINDDLNTPNALAAVWEAVKNKQIKLSTLLKFDKIFGLKIKENIKTNKNIPADIKKMVQERNKARKNKDWIKSDELRKKIEEKGYKIEDNNLKTIIKKIK